MLESNSTKWRVKVAACEVVADLTNKGSAQVAEHLGEIIPRLTVHMSDTKVEVRLRYCRLPSAVVLTLPLRKVSGAAIKSAERVCSVLTNPDVIPFVPLLVECMSTPDRLAEGVKKLSANVWVRDVDGPTLAVITPLIARALNDRNTTVQRQSVLLVANMFKMVRSPDLAAKHVPRLLPGVTKIYESAAFPEIRAFAGEAKDALEASIVGAAATVSDEAEKKQLAEDAQKALEMLFSLVTKEMGTGAPSGPFATSLAWVSTTISQLVSKRDFADEQWKSVYVAPYLARFMPENQARAVAAEALKRWIEIDRVCRRTWPLTLNRLIAVFGTGSQYEH